MSTLLSYIGGALAVLSLGFAAMELWLDGTLPVLIVLAVCYYGLKAGRAVVCRVSEQ
jgi:hypothetical protein